MDVYIYMYKFKKGRIKMTVENDANTVKACAFVIGNLEL